MKKLTSLILQKLGVAVSGPIGWAASLLIDKLLGFLFNLLRDLAVAAKEKYENNQAKKEEAKAEDRYEDTLKEGANEEDQVNASIDVINSGNSD